MNRVLSNKFCVQQNKAHDTMYWMAHLSIWGFRRSNEYMITICYCSLSTYQYTRALYHVIVWHLAPKCKEEWTKKNCKVIIWWWSIEYGIIYSSMCIMCSKCLFICFDVDIRSRITNTHFIFAFVKMRTESNTSFSVLSETMQQWKKIEKQRSDTHFASVISIWILSWCIAQAHNGETYYLQKTWLIAVISGSWQPNIIISCICRIFFFLHPI